MTSIFRENSVKLQPMAPTRGSIVDAILTECEACHKAHPNNHVRLLGFDNYAQSAGASMVIYRGKAV